MVAWWSEIRPALVIRDALLVGNQSYSQLHRAYKSHIRIAREAGGAKQRGMVYSSFITVCTRLRQAGLINRVAAAPLTEPLQTVPPGTLIGIRDNEVVEQTMTLLEITEAGRAAADEEWLASTTRE